MKTRFFLEFAGCPAMLPKTLFLFVLVIGCSPFTASQVSVVERSYNRLRTGANTTETILTPANVRSSAINSIDAS